MGIILPIMGTKRSAARRRRVGIADALFSKVQQRVLALLFGQPSRRFQSSELIRLVAGGTGATQRCLRGLVDSELVTVTAIGNQRHYQANTRSPVFGELHTLVLRTVALVEPLRELLAPLREQIHEAFVFGSIAKGTERASSDVDLMIISDTLSYEDLYDMLLKAELDLARPVNPILRTMDQWRTRLAQDGSFSTRIDRGEKIVILEARNGAGGAGESGSDRAAAG